MSHPRKVIFAKKLSYFTNLTFSAKYSTDQAQVPGEIKALREDDAYQLAEEVPDDGNRTGF